MELENTYTVYSSFSDNIASFGNDEKLSNLPWFLRGPLCLRHVSGLGLLSPDAPGLSSYSADPLRPRPECLRSGLKPLVGS